MESSFSSSTTGPSQPNAEPQEDVTLGHNPHTGTIINKIEDIGQKMLEALDDHRVPLTMTMRHRSNGREYEIRFPSSNLREMKKFGMSINI